MSFRIRWRRSKVRWLLFDRTIEDEVGGEPSVWRFTFRRSLDLMYPWLSRVGTRQLACGCRRRIGFTLFSLDCPLDHSGFNAGA